LTFHPSEVDHAVRNAPILGKFCLLAGVERPMSLRSSKLRLLCIASSLFFIGVMGWGRCAYSQQPQTRGRQNGASNPATEEQKSKGGDLELLPVQGSVSMVAGAGGNITVQAGRDGIVLVDTGLGTMSDKVLQLIRPLSKGQITYIINTDHRSDHVGGNETFAKSGRPLAIDRASGASVMIVAFNTVLDRMSAPTGQAAPTPEKAWPNDTYSTPQKNLFFNGEAIQVFHQPATTDGNSIVFFRHSDVISTGDLFDPTEYPIIDLKSGGSLQAIIDGLYRIKQIAIPADHQEGGTMLVPGHGRICDVADLAVYHQMLVIIRDRLQDMIKQGMTLEQVKAAKPTRDYDPIYGSDTGNWTTDMFVEAAYKSLTAKTDPTSSRKAN
jgi:cyclase